MITLFTTHCPRCRIIEMKLAQKKINFETVEDEDKIRETGIAHHIMSAPILKVDDEYFDFNHAVEFINKR